MRVLCVYYCRGLQRVKVEIVLALQCLVTSVLESLTLLPMVITIERTCEWPLQKTEPIHNILDLDDKNYAACQFSQLSIHSRGSTSQLATTEIPDLAVPEFQVRDPAVP